MRLIESLNKGVTTTLPLKPGTPRSVWFDVYDKMFDDRDCFIVIFDQEPASFSGAALDLLEEARYIGRPLKALANGFEMMSMPGMYNVPGHNVYNLRTGGLTGPQIFTSLKGQTVVHGDVGLSAAPGGLLQFDFNGGVPLLELWESVAEGFGVTWKMDRLGRVVWSTTYTDVFPSTPALAVVDLPAEVPEKVGGVPTAKGRVTRFAADAGHFCWLVFSYYDGGSGSYVVANAGGPSPTPAAKLLPSITLPWSAGRYLDLSSVSDATEAENLADAYLERYNPINGPRVVFGLEVGSLPGGDIEPGDTVWAFAPDYRVEDTTLDAVDVNGALLHPRSLFVEFVDAPTHADMCVAVYSADAETWSVISDHVELDEPGAVTELKITSELPTVRTGGGVGVPANTTSDVTATSGEVKR